MLSESEQAACFEVLYRGLVHIRAAAGAGDHLLAASIANALHNLPHFMAGVVDSGKTLREFQTFFLDRLYRVDRDIAAHILEPLSHVC